MTIDEFIARHGVTMQSRPAASNPNMDAKDMDHWTCTLRLPGGRKRMTVPFSMGSGHHGKHPELAEVLNCLASDADVSDSFEEFCADLGFDTDSRKAERVHKACLRHRELLRTFLDGELQELLECERL